MSTQPSQPQAIDNKLLFLNISPRVCARVLTYVQGMDLDPVMGIELALECLQRTAPKAAPPPAVKRSAQEQEERIVRRAMKTLYALLDERGLSGAVTDKNGGRLWSAPPMNRKVMIPEELDISPVRSALKKLFRRGDNGKRRVTAHTGHSSRLPWSATGTLRRMVLLTLIFVPTGLAASVMYALLPSGGYPVLRAIITALFAVLFAWISVGFWSSMAGLLMLLTRCDRFSLSRDVPKDAPIAEDTRTALLFPVYNEDPHSVAAIIRTVLRSLKDAGLERHFDIFMLSDSTSPDVWIREEEAWYTLCREENAFGKVFYRRRKMNMKRKSGNIADFCRRWGANYRYMIIFDADSLISADSLAHMVRIMEAHPLVGILQTPPKTIKARSLLARAQQFANHLYGPLFAAGLQYWQLGDAQYWGHNAILRIEPFMRHCQLPALPGKAPLGGEILSHDFVESALMRRAGYGVWLAYDLEGSYEQSPPGLIEELIRDRRWCQGNLQHARLIFTKGFFPTHRALFINGIMSYVSALLWFLFLAASSVQAIAELFVVPEYFPAGVSLFPDWPKYFPNWALSLFSGTMTLLFLPKLFSLALVIGKGGAKAFGGVIAMSASLIAEVLLSTLLAPVRMFFHSLFVIGAVFGKSWGWNTQNRDDRGTSWGEALRFYWKGTLLGLLWGGLLYLVNPGFFLWMSPIAAGLALSIPFAVWSSRVSLGEKARRMGLFLTPVETEPDAIITGLETHLRQQEPYTPIAFPDNAGFVRATVLPRINSLHWALAQHKRRTSDAKASRLHEMMERAAHHGPDALSAKEKLILLNEPEWLNELHRMVWMLPPSKAALWSIR